VCAELFKRKYKVVKADSRVYFRAYPRQKTMPARLVFRGNLIPTLQLLLTFFFQNSRLKYYGTAQSDLTETEYCLSDCRMIFFLLPVLFMKMGLRLLCYLYPHVLMVGYHCGDKTRNNGPLIFRSLCLRLWIRLPIKSGRLD
jgi:hypothetical protein